MGRAQFQWQAVTNASYSVVGAAAKQLGTGLGVLEDPVTVRRCIIDVFLLLSAPVDNMRSIGRVGFIAADPTVIAAGSASMPGPTTDADQEWLWNRGWSLSYEIGAAGTQQDGGFLHLHDDVRGMRKLKQRDTLAFVIETQAISTAMEWWATARVLVST